MQDPNQRLPPFSRDWALFLDVDGTLLDFIDDPSRSRATSDLTRMLSSIRDATGGALALVSGRTIESLDAIFAPLRLPAAGLHGQDRRDASGRIRTGTPGGPTLADARQRFLALADRHPGAFVEDKGPGFALHYRVVPEAEPEARRLAADVERRLPPSWCVQHGKMVVEVRSAETSKGDAIAAFMQEPPFSGRVPVFAGDDVTDEHGFEWVNANGGISVKVGPGDTAARHRIDGVGAVRAWLADYAAFAEAEPREEHGG